MYVKNVRKSNGKNEDSKREAVNIYRSLLIKLQTEKKVQAGEK